MPLVHIELLEGRTPEQLKGLVEDVTAAIAKNANVPAERIHIVLSEMKHDHYAVGGKLTSEK
ncbi:MULTISPECIES: 2-hydroxymuconate tautomerase [Lactobacillaceae]|uniref:Tautomerase n=1 Tax=Limosilactobacillus alvi TaxID=990412 RepID=A0ABS2EQ08_9LACO|nr:MULTISPECIES: 2-hydroxymuconate tautomerase [Lactobacillaceae]MBM6754301.1 4-oxalocrotonate tautomerase [Limosilactobacillus alvi]QLL69951.1 4-oxalocrotonate tautomerase [Lactobacillus sp. 3B(2020)]